MTTVPSSGGVSTSVRDANTFSLAVSLRLCGAIAIRKGLRVLSMEWAGQEWMVLADKALYWPAQRMLIVADMHLGKAASFRHHGVPVPGGSTSHDLARLSALINQTQCSRLVILGDFLHAKAGRADETMRLIHSWRARHATIDIMLVRGNHDAHAGDPPLEWGIACVDEPLSIDSIAMRHALAPARSEAEFTIAGHVHPCVRLHDTDGSSMRAACFLFSDHRREALLPAFGSFTGTHPVQPREGDRVFAVGANEVIEVAGVCA
jgi:DNA ligase-associated metallophosphoesterase